ncbi:MAG: hypothetical protein ACYCPA_00585 [Acidithiobacillus sp.]
MNKKHLVLLALSGALALGLAGCGKHEGPYSGHHTHYFVTHKKALNRQVAWCKKHETGTSINKTCGAAVQALSQIEMNTFLAPPAPGQNAMGSGSAINLGNPNQFYPTSKR